MAVKIVCDFCDRPLEFDVERGSYVMYRTKRFSTQSRYPHLCKSCAEKLDDIFEVYNTELIRKADLALEQAKLNLERRDKLETNG